MTTDRDSLRNRMQAYEARESQASTSGQDSGDRASCATMDGKTAAILGAVVDVRQIVSDWANYGYKAKKQMKKLAYAINNNPELHAAMLEFEKPDSYAAWFIANGDEECEISGKSLEAQYFANLTRASVAIDKMVRDLMTGGVGGFWINSSEEGIEVTHQPADEMVKKPECQHSFHFAHAHCIYCGERE